MLAYHAKTMHSYQSVRDGSHFMDWDHQPSSFKIYPEHFTRIPLHKTNPMHRFFILIGGLSAQKSYPSVTYSLRTNPSAGALYPTEVYVQIKEVRGFEDGIYHLNQKEQALVRLCSLAHDEGLEPLLHVKKITGFLFLFSTLYYRSSWKYRNRAFRYCLQDTGHMLGTLEASCYLLDKSYHILYDGDKQTLNQFFGFGKEEFFLSFACVGDEQPFTCKLPATHLDSCDGTHTFESNILVERAYESTFSLKKQPQMKMPHCTLDKDSYLKTIWNRRSIRDFNPSSAISQEHFQTIMEFITQPIPSDCDTRVDIYAVINRVEGLWRGLWKEGAYLKSGDFANLAGYLCLEQALGAQSAVTFFLVGDESENYQALMQKAGIIGHRLYLISNYLGIGCSGIGAYYDEEVATFLETEGMILYALVIGK